MDIEDMDAVRRGRSDAAGHGCRDVVKLQVEKNSATREGAENRWSLRREELLAHFKEVDDRRESVAQTEGLVTGRDVESNDELGSLAYHPGGTAVTSAMMPPVSSRRACTRWRRQ